MAKKVKAAPPQPPTKGKTCSYQGYSDSRVSKGDLKQTFKG